MSRRQVDATDGIDDQHTTELEQITNNLQAMAADHTEDNTEPEGAVCGALNIPELLGIVLSHLPIRDLTRALSVSKQWNRTIHNSMELRHILFLEPAPVKEYLEHTGWYRFNMSRSLDKRYLRSVIVYGSSEHSKTIVEPHPVIASACNPESRNHQQVRGLSLEMLKSVSPSTLLFQPPPKRVSVHYGLARIPGPTEVTFGAIVEGYEKARALAEGMVSLSLGTKFEHEYSGLLVGTEDSINTATWGALASNANCVRVAREAME